MGNLLLNTLAAHQQATGSLQKNSEQNARYLLTIMTKGSHICKIQKSSSAKTKFKC
jgi:hypothetical protein